MASVCSLIITTFLSLLLYQNVLIEEAQKKRLMLEKALKKNFHLIDNWQRKISSAGLKLKTILIMTSSYRKKLMELEQAKNKNRKELTVQNNLQLNLIENQIAIENFEMNKNDKNSLHNSKYEIEIENSDQIDKNVNIQQNLKLKNESEKIDLLNEKENKYKNEISNNQEIQGIYENSIEKNKNSQNSGQSIGKNINLNEGNLEDLKINSMKFEPNSEDKFLLNKEDFNNNLTDIRDNSFKLNKKRSFEIKLETNKIYGLNKDNKTSILKKRKNKNKNFEKGEMRCIFKNEENPMIEENNNNDKPVLRKISADTNCYFFDKREKSIFLQKSSILENPNLKKSKKNNETFIITNGRNEKLNNLENLNETSNSVLIKEQQKIKVYLQVDLQIEKTEINYDALKKNKYKEKKKLIVIKKRGFIFPSNLNIFSCNQISITNIATLDYISGLIRTGIKTFIIIFLYLYIWLYLMVFIESIYKQYGKNIVKICVMPLISMLFIKLVITFNVMMFMTTVILYFWGDYFLNTIKLPLIPMVIFKGLVPPLAFHHYSALKLFRELIKNN